MQPLTRVHCPTLLTQAKTYQIDRTLYRYLYKTGSVVHTQYHFRPLAGQRKKADLVLNKPKLLARVYEIEGMQQGQVLDENSIQLSIF